MKLFFYISFAAASLTGSFVLFWAGNNSGGWALTVLAFWLLLQIEAEL